MPIGRILDRVQSADGIADGPTRAFAGAVVAAWSTLFRWADQVTEWVRTQEAHPLAAARLVTATIGTGDTTIFHGLGRVPTGWWVASPNASATVWSQTASAIPAETIVLRASAAVTVTLVVF